MIKIKFIRMILLFECIYKGGFPKTNKKKSTIIFHSRLITNKISFHCETVLNASINSKVHIFFYFFLMNENFYLNLN